MDLIRVLDLAAANKSANELSSHQRKVFRVADHARVALAGLTTAAPMASVPTGVACLVYPWPSNAAKRGAKVFMQSDCAACHSALPYAGLRGAAVPGQDAGAMTAEILVAEEARPAGMTTTPLHGGAAAQTPDLATVVTRIQGGLRGNLYSTGTAELAGACQELKKSPVWLQFAQAFQAA